jgi:ribose transport system substrate-binding protein
MEKLGRITMRLFTKGLFAAITVIALHLLVAPVNPASAAAKCVTGERKAPYTIGWANIYSVPTWMKQTQGTLEDVFNQLKEKGLTDRLIITDAEGNANTQITQIQSMIDADVDAIILIAGSATALDRVVADACKKGIVIINFDSLVSTEELTAKVNTDSAAWGKQAAEFLVKELGGKGKILIMNGPAGVSVSEDRRAGATATLQANPGIEILAETNTPYNVAPAQEAVTNLLFSHPQIDGILSLGGALTAGAILAMDKQGRPMVPMTGENYRQFLELWKEKNLRAWATMQPNWLAGFSTYVAVQALEGKDIPAFVKVPLPVIDNSSIDDYLARAKDFPADGYIFSPYSLETFEQLLTNQ